MTQPHNSSHKDHRDCVSDHTCQGHDPTHSHGPNCGHATENHEGHVDYVVDGHLHHVHNGHCDHHGKSKAA